MVLLVVLVVLVLVGHVGGCGGGGCGGGGLLGVVVYLGCVLFTVWRLFVAQWVFVSPSLSGFDRGGISTWSFVSLDMGAFQMCC